MNGRQRRTHVRRSGRASASEWRRPPHTPPDRACACPHASLGATTTRPSRPGSSAAAVRGSPERTALRKPAGRLGDRSSSCPGDRSGMRHRAAWHCRWIRWAGALDEVPEEGLEPPTRGTVGHKRTLWRAALRVSSEIARRAGLSNSLAPPDPTGRVLIRRASVRASSIWQSVAGHAPEGRSLVLPVAGGPSAGATALYGKQQRPPKLRPLPLAGDGRSGAIPTLHPGLCGCGRRDSTRHDVNARRDASRRQGCLERGADPGFSPVSGDAGGPRPA